MYARIATFEGAGPEQREAAERLTREEFIPRTRELQGYAGYLSLYDADAERAVSIVLFDDEDSLRGGDQALDAMSPPDELRGIRRTGVDKYEVVMHEIRGEASAARFSRLEGPPERIDDGMSHARVRFVYNTSFHCTERADACLTDDNIAPFAFNSEALTATDCSGGCSITVPAMPGRLLYYRVETYDGSAWTNGDVMTAVAE